MPVTLPEALTITVDSKFSPIKLPPDPLPVIKLPAEIFPVLVMLPAAEINPPVKILPPVMLPAADINPPVKILPPVMFADEVIVDVADINPPVNKLPLVVLPTIVAVVAIFMELR